MERTRNAQPWPCEHSSRFVRGIHRIGKDRQYRACNGTNVAIHTIYTARWEALS